jgi:hypothetical protein
MNDFILRLVSMLEQAMDEWESNSSDVCRDRCTHRGGLEVCDPDLGQMRTELAMMKEAIGQ